MIVGSTVGLLLGARLPTRTRDTVTDALGLVTLLIGALSAAEVGSAALAGTVGVRRAGADCAWCHVVRRHCRLLLDIEGRLEGFRRLAANAAGAASLRRTATHCHRDAGWRGPVKARFRGNGSTDAAPSDVPPGSALSRGFVTASLVFCVGPLTILGSLSDGLGRGADQLILKAALDGFASIAFAAALGAGVMASVVAIVVVQGSLTLVGGWLAARCLRRNSHPSLQPAGCCCSGSGCGCCRSRRYPWATCCPRCWSRRHWSGSWRHSDSEELQHLCSPWKEASWWVSAALRRADVRPAAGSAPRESINVGRRRSGPCRRRANAHRPPTRPVARASSYRCRSSRGTRPGCPRRRPARPSTISRMRGGCTSDGQGTAGLCRRAGLAASSGAHYDRRSIPCEPDRDGPRRAVLGNVGQAGQVAGQELLADRTVQDVGDLARLHGHPFQLSFSVRSRLTSVSSVRLEILSLVSSSLSELDCLPHRWPPARPVVAISPPGVGQPPTPKRTLFPRKSEPGCPEMGTWPADWLAAGLKMAMLGLVLIIDQGGEWRSVVPGT